jgi:hypothetical protein
MRYPGALLVALVATFALALPSTAAAQHAAKGKKKTAEATETTAASTTPADEALREPTPEEMAEFAATVKTLVNDDPTGLLPVTMADGTVAIDLQDRFQSIAVAVKREGTIETRCVTSSKEADALAKPSVTPATTRPAGLEEK